jgi:hypothetical protein
MLLARRASRWAIRRQWHLPGCEFRCRGKPVRLLLEGTRPSRNNYRHASGRTGAIASPALIASETPDLARHSASTLGGRRLAVPATLQGPRLARLIIGALALFGAPLLEASHALAQEGGPGSIQLPKAQIGPISPPGPAGPRDELGVPSRVGPKGSTIRQALGCHYAKCLQSARSCIQLHGRGGYRVCPPVIRR